MNLVELSPKTVDWSQSKVTTYLEPHDIALLLHWLCFGFTWLLGFSPWILSNLAVRVSFGLKQASSTRGLGPGSVHKGVSLSVGGGTSAKGCFGLVGFPDIELPPTVQRKIGNIIDHGEPPHPCSASPRGKHYKMDDLVRLAELDLPRLGDRLRVGEVAASQ